jgi:hypothetical protein
MPMTYRDQIEQSLREAFESRLPDEIDAQIDKRVMNVRSYFLTS